MASARKQKTPPPRTARADGNATRLHILDTAGQVFADKGYAGATSKEICERAGTNMAAVNYHFGSRDDLYRAVLVEAHRQFLSLEDLAEIADSAAGAPARLRALMAQLVENAARSGAPWGFRVLLREVMMPSPLISALVDDAVLPKARIVLGLVAEILGLPPDHPAVHRSLIFVIFPCAGLAIAPQAVRGRILPGLDASRPGLLDDMMRFIMAGLQAMARAHAP